MIDCLINSPTTPTARRLQSIVRRAMFVAAIGLQLELVESNGVTSWRAETHFIKVYFNSPAAQPTSIATRESCNARALNAARSLSNQRFYNFELAANNAAGAAWGY